MEQEVPQLLAGSEKGWLRVVCIPVTSSGAHVTALSELHWPRPMSEPLAELDERFALKALREICDAIDPLLPRVVESADLEVVSRAPAAVLKTSDRLGELFGVPPPPVRYVPRSGLIGKLLTELQSDAGRSLGVRGQHATVGVHGVGGVGKTVAAIGLANEPQARATFPDGIYWVTLGIQPDLIGAQTTLARQLGEPDPDVTSFISGHRLLQTLMADKRALIILDDVWSKAAAQAFDVVGPQSRVLFTTRNELLLKEAGAESFDVGSLTGDEARQFLAHWAGANDEDLPEEADEVIAATSGVPLALAMVGSSVRHGASWDASVATLASQAEVFAAHPYADTFKAIHAAVTALDSLDRELYRQLVVFPEDAEVPARDVARLWQRTGHVTPSQARALAENLAQRQLLRLNRNSDTMAFHDLQRDFLLLAVDDQALIHADLVEAYRGLLRPVEAGTGWSTLPTDEAYAINRLIYHLIQAGYRDEAYAVSVDPAFVALQIAQGGIHAAEATLKSATETESSPGDAHHLEQTLRQGGHLFRTRGSPMGLAEIAATLRGLLATHETWEAALDPLIERPSLRSRWPSPSVTPMLIRVLEGQGGRVSRVVFSSDGCVLATAGPVGDWESDFVRVWNAIDGTPVLEFRVFDGVKALEFSPSGAVLATASSDDDGRVRLRNLIDASRGPVLEADGVGSTRLIVFSPDEVRIATVSRDGNVRLWNSRDGSPGPVFDHGARVRWVVFTADGARIVSAGDDHTVRVWDASTGTPGAIHEVSRVSARRGTWLASAEDDGTVLVWDAADAKSERVVIEGHSGGVQKLAFSPDGARLASASRNGAVQLWDTTNGASGPVLPGRPGLVKDLVFHANGAKLAATGLDRKVFIWDLTDPEVAPAVVAAPATGPMDVSPDGTRLATTDSTGTLHIWDLADVASGPTVTQGHPRGVTQLIFSPKGTRLASGGADGAVRLWDPHQLVGSDVEMHRGLVTQVAFSRNGARLLSVGRDDRVRSWATVDGAPGPVHQLGGVLSPHATLLALSKSDGTVLIWDLADVASGPLVLEGHTVQVKTLAFAPDDTRLVTTSPGDAIRLWDARDGTSLSDPFESSVKDAASVAWSPDSAWLAAGDSYGNVRLWNTVRAVAGAVFAGHSEEVNQVDFSPDGAWLASTSYDGRVRLWNLADGTSGPTIRGRSDDVNRVVFSPDGSRLALMRKTGGAVQLFQLGSDTPDRLVADLQTGSDVSQAAFSPDSARLITANTRTGMVALWDARSGRALSAMRPARSITSLDWHETGLVAAAGDTSVFCLEILEPRESRTREVHP